MAPTGNHDFPDNVGEHNIFNILDFKRAGGDHFQSSQRPASLLVGEPARRKTHQAPTNIVFNRRIVGRNRNGLSCMSCHANGMRLPTDDVRATPTPLPAYEHKYAAALYPENKIPGTAVGRSGAI
jgi:hypothetical protein